MLDSLKIPNSQPPTQSIQNESFSSFQSVINQLTIQQSKFCTIFIENWDVFQVNVSSYEIMSTPHIFGSKFVTYRLKVLTDHICYYIDKRYRDFLDLYNAVSKFFQPKTTFPKKTHIKSKISQQLTQSRKKAFDALISQIISIRHSNKSVISQLIIFLDIKNHYNASQMDQNIFLINHDNFSDYAKDKGYLLSHLLRHQMLKINYLPKQSLRFLSELQFLIGNINKCYSKVQDLRIILVGAQKIPGLIQVSLTNQNEIVGVSFMKLIKKLLKIQSCPYAQNFKKILQTSQSHIFILHHDEALQNEQFVSNYFELIDMYLKIKSQANLELVSDQFIKQFLSPWTAKKYYTWIEERSSIENQMRRNSTFGRIIQRQIQQIKQIPLEVQEPVQECKKIFQKELILFSSEYKQLFRQDKSFCQVSSDKKFMHFCFFTNKSFDQLGQVIKKWKHNSLIKSYSPSSIFTNVCKIFIEFEGKSQKLFQFQQKITNQQQNSQIKRQTQIYLSPPESILNVNSFYYNAKLSEMKQGCKVQILYYFHTKKNRKLFEEQLDGKSNIMWVNGCESILGQFQIYPQKRCQSSPTKTSQTL